MIKKTIDGNEACASVSYLFTEVAGIYPITPSSPMAEVVDKWASAGKKNIFNDEVKVVEMQSELGAAGMVHGSLRSGLLTSTYTSSQGLLLMIPNLYKIAGELLPGVINVAARSLSTHALSIMGDHQDIFAARATGVCMLASSSVQDIVYMTLLSHLASLSSSLPFMNFFDGFRTSHEINKIDVIEKDDVLDLIDYKAIEQFRNKGLNPLKPYIIGTNQSDDIYFQNTEARNIYYEKAANIVLEYMNKINKKFGTDYKPFNYYGNEQAEKVIVAMGSVCETIKEFIEGTDYGLVEVHLYRPFSTNFLLDVLPESTKKIAVLNRTKEAGSIGEPLYLDVLAALKNKNIEIVSGRYGLSSKDTTPGQIKAVYEMLDDPKDNFTIGIEDDITHLSLKYDEYKTSTSDEVLIFGYGSDGMISASKILLKIIGEKTDNYVQGYFEYDSKKSGGITVSHLRFNKNKIHSSYYVDNPKLIVISKDNYLNSFDCVSKLKENGTVLINTEHENLDFASDDVKKLLIEKNAKVYLIDAYGVARNHGLTNKISMIMESAILKLQTLIDYDKAIEEVKENIKTKFKKKGSDVINANIDALDEINLKEIKVTLSNKEIEKPNSLYEKLSSRKGNELKTSDFLNIIDGRFLTGTAKLDKPKISQVVACYNKDKCIECNQCSFVCPHGVIRTYLLDNEEYEKAPEFVKDRCKKAIGPGLENYHYALAISKKDCTGCGLCKDICPTGAITLNMYSDPDVYDYLEENVSDKKVNRFTLKGSQFVNPSFKFPKSCAGCGQTAYLKLLSQLFKENLVIANATGCSSIYGGNIPNIPYETPWASSLFEDNAEYGYGMVVADRVMKNRIRKIMENNLEGNNKELFEKWISNPNDYEITKEVYEKIDYSSLEELSQIKDYIISKNIWIVGGDGWAYDIGFSGIDQVLSSNDNAKILVLDSELYSNTGGQASKSSPRGSVESFASSGKKTAKKDLAKIALAYPNAYVAQVSLGANMMQLIKAFKEANEYNGPAIIIAYTPCIAHGFKEGSATKQKLATQSGYFPIFRYNPQTKVFNLDSKADFDLYEKYIEGEARYAMLKSVNPDKAKELLEASKKDAMERYAYYENLTK